MAAGYTNVTTIEADDGHYEGVGVLFMSSTLIHTQARSPRTK
jgi:hypothetical protein